MKSQGIPRVAQKLLIKKNKVEGLILTNYKTYYKASLVKVVYKKQSTE